MLGVVAGDAAAGVGFKEKIFDAEGVGGQQNIFVVVDEERSLLVESERPLRPSPEMDLFFRQTDIAGTEDRIKVGGEDRLSELDLNRPGVSVGHESDLLLLLLDEVEERLHAGMDLNPIADALFERDDVDAEPPGPVFDVGPVQRFFFGAVGGQQLVLGGLEGDFFELRKFFGDQLFPEVIIEMFVEKGSIHVEQDGIDQIPLDHSNPFSKGPLSRRTNPDLFGNPVPIGQP